jgi:hypothetical protein
VNAIHALSQLSYGPIRNAAVSGNRDNIHFTTRDFISKASIAIWPKAAPGVSVVTLGTRSAKVGTDFAQAIKLAQIA